MTVTELRAVVAAPTGRGRGAAVAPRGA